MSHFKWNRWNWLESSSIFNGIWIPFYMNYKNENDIIYGNDTKHSAVTDCTGDCQHDSLQCDWWWLQHSLQWRHNGHDGVSNHQPYNCLLNHLLRHWSKKTSKLRVTGLCLGNSPVTSEFPAQMASTAENVSIWWHRHATSVPLPPAILTSVFTIMRSLHCGWWQGSVRQIYRNGFWSVCHSMYDVFWFAIKIFDLT